MATETYLADCIVLKKTKLGEADLILTFLNERGERTQGVAKGARKPQSSFSSYLELGNVVHILFARGKKLPVITETRLLASHPLLQTDAARFAAASSILEFVAKTSEENLEQPRLFAMTTTALDACETLPAVYLPHLVAAFFLKAVSFSGLRPSIRLCASCGMPTDLAGTSYLSFSVSEGGVVCDRCALDVDHRSTPTSDLALAEALIGSRFDDIPALDENAGRGRAMIDLAQMWVAAHTATRIRSLDLLELYC